MVGTRGHRSVGRCVLAVAVSGSLALVSSPSVSAAGAVSAPDRQATLAYLQAEYDYVAALGTAARGSLGAAGTFAASVQAGCPNALAGLPEQTVTFTESEPRAEGRAARREHDRTAVELELSAGAEAAFRRARKEAGAKLAAAVTPLRWSDPRIATAVAGYLAYVQAPEPLPLSSPQLRSPTAVRRLRRRVPSRAAERRAGRLGARTSAMTSTPIAASRARSYARRWKRDSVPEQSASSASCHVRQRASAVAAAGSRRDRSRHRSSTHGSPRRGALHPRPGGQQRDITP